MTFGSRMSYEAAYVKARKKAVKQLKTSNAQQLEIETKKMEERIRTLKEQMFKEKEEREKLGGTRWASGKAGPLNSHAQDVLKKKSSKTDKPQRRIKILGDEPLQSYKKKTTPRAQQPDDVGSSGCGQCERTKATLVCVECAEKYCVSCFMSFHQKGALKKHITQSIEQYESAQLQEKDKNTVNYSKPELSPPKNVTRMTSRVEAKSPQFGDSTRQQGGALLEGSYNEEESAQSFAQALMEWRNAGKEEKMWTNPTANKSNTCETSTTPEPPKQLEVKLTFGPNKCLSYLDRVLLKKHHGDPNLVSQLTPVKEGKNKGLKQMLSDKTPQNETENQLGTNYREIFQSLGAPKKTSHAGETVQLSKGVVSIEELNDEDPSMEETTACIIEEDTHPPPQGRPVSRSGNVSILCMTPSGHFEADTQSLVSITSPSSDQSLRPGITGADSHLGQGVVEKSYLNDGLERVWSPQPRHVGLSDFFLAGVKEDSSSGRQSRQRVTAFGPASVKPENLSKGLLSQNVWKPHESVSESEERGKRELDEKQGERSGSSVRHESPRPIIPLLREPDMSAKSHGDRPDSRSSTIALPVTSDLEYDTEIHDFGIVDFLKAETNLPNGYEGYSLIHRVSTVSPLTLSSNPPLFHWSDDSDDEFLEQICARASQDELKADQDEADRATLTDLAWELASTTGRLTQCELDEEEKEEGEGGEEFDEDSIENNDFGSGLSSSEEDASNDTYSANLNKTKHKSENALAEAEVHALK